MTTWRWRSERSGTKPTGDGIGRRLPKVGLLVVPALLFAAACSNDSNQAPTATATSSGTTATATHAASPSASATTTTAGGGTATATASTGVGQTTPFDVPGNVPAATNATLTDVRAASHDTFDRIVFEFADGLQPPARIEYVASVSQCGSGLPVTVPGGAILQVRMEHAQAHDNNGQPTADRTVAGTGNIIAGAVSVCDFEGVVTYAIGVPSQLPFVASTLSNPARLVIDIQKSASEK